MKFRHVLLILFITVLVVFSANGCQSSYQAIELVPEKANLIATIEISKIVEDKDIRDTYESMEKAPDQPRTVDELIGKIFEDSGMDIDDFSRVLLFGDMSDLERSEYICFIVEGNFDENRFIDNVEENTGEKLSTSVYKSHDLYINEKDETTFAFLGDKTLLVGSNRAVKDSIDVNEGDGKPADNQLIDTYQRYDDALISVAFKVTGDTQDIFSQDITDDMPFSMGAFNEMDMIGFSLDKENEFLNAVFELHLPDSESAQDVHDAISGLISLFKGLMDEPEVKEMLGNIEISVSNSWVTINMEIDLSQIEDLMETFE